MTGSKLPAPSSMLFSRKRRLLWLSAALLVGIVAAGFAHASLLREVASFLIVEDPLQPAAAMRGSLLGHREGLGGFGLKRGLRIFEMADV